MYMPVHRKNLEDNAQETFSEAYVYLKNIMFIIIIVVCLLLLHAVHRCVLVTHKCHSVDVVMDLFQW